MKVLRRRRWITDLQIILGAELQISFESRAGMLRSLSLITMRQQNDQTRRLLPLIFRSSDVLIDDRLGAIGEVAELCLPQNQRLMRDHRVAVFEAEHTFFGKRTVKNIETRGRIFLRAQFRKRRPGLASLRIVQNGVALAESAAPGILAAQAYARAFQHNRSKGHAFGSIVLEGTRVRLSGPDSVRPPSALS